MRLIIINGLPGTGKTTLAKPLSDLMSIPVISKDTIKEFLFDTIGVGDREWSRQLGAASSDFLYELADIMLLNGRSFIIENAFEASFARPKLQKLITQHNPGVVEIYCTTDSEVRKKRFVQRHESGDRHAGHVDDKNYQNNFDPEPLDKYPPLRLGKLLTIDTTNSISPEEIINQINQLQDSTGSDNIETQWDQQSSRN